MRRLLIFAAFVFGSVACLQLLTQSAGQVQAATASDFRAGKIISDSNFFKDDAMTAEQIQQFLEAKVPDCDTLGEKPHAGTTRRAYSEARGHDPPYTCLRDYRTDIPARSPEESLCDGFSASANQRASAIIDAVARSCGISQKVLLVLLQKEQSLVTDEWPWENPQYRSATGFGCPDTAPCDEEFYGFFNQVYRAARVYKVYAKYPDDYNHIAGERNMVRYNPNPVCGDDPVFIENQATAGLYNYTPYQPNDEALANLYGTGNSCSAYGNRNFWRIYTDWFGSTLTESQPITSLIGDWGASGADEVGFRRGSHYYYDTNNDGVADKDFGIGRASDKVLVGDWDNDGKDEIGLRRGNRFFFDNNNDGDADVDFVFGLATDQVIVGDWDGDGDDTLGLKRGSHYYLNNGNDGVADIDFGIGRSTDVVVVGDWNGDNMDRIGLRRGTNYYFDTDNDGRAEVAFGIGRTTDQVIIGDWDGDGDDNIGLKRGASHYLDTDNDRTADIYVGIGRSSDVVITGDWDADGADEVGLKRYNRYYYDNNSDGDADLNFLLNYF